MDSIEVKTKKTHTEREEKLILYNRKLSNSKQYFVCSSIKLYSRGEDGSFVVWVVVEAKTYDNFVEELRSSTHQFNNLLSNWYLECTIFASSLTCLNVFHFTQVYGLKAVSHIYLSFRLPYLTIIGTLLYYAALHLFYNSSKEWL